MHEASSNSGNLTRPSVGTSKMTLSVEDLEGPSGPRARRRVVVLDVADVVDGLEDAVDAVLGGVVIEDSDY